VLWVGWLDRWVHTLWDGRRLKCVE
jgi:hypothetical protein